MGPDAMILVFWMLRFKPAFSLSSFTFIKRLFSSSSLSAIRVWCVICISEVIDISPCNIDSSLCFIQPSISHDVLCIYIYGCKYDYPQILISCLNNFQEWRLLDATIHSTLPTGQFMKSSNICLKLSPWCPATAPLHLLLLQSAQFWLFPQPGHLEPLILFQVATTIHPLEWLNINEKKKKKKDNRKHWYDGKETWNSRVLLMRVKLLQFILKYVFFLALSIKLEHI